MIPADLGAELTTAVLAAVAAGDLPPAAAGVSPAGTWRPAPGRNPASYATSLPFELARLAGRQPAAVAATLAGVLRTGARIASARPTGNGYLTITVTSAALAELAIRIPRAGPAVARSAALRGVTTSAPPLPDLAAAPAWRHAWCAQAAALTGRLALAAGATVTESAGQDFFPKLRLRHPRRGTEPGPGPVAAAASHADSDAIRYSLSRILASRAAEADQGVSVSYHLAEPWYLVSFAHADAASTQRWAADLGLRRVVPGRPLDDLLGRPAEAALLGRLSWIAERVAGAARRRRPAELPRYLEAVAAAWLDCRETCPALPFGGRSAPPDEAGISARLWLAAATQTVLAAGLDLIGVTPRERM